MGNRLAVRTIERAAVITGCAASRRNTGGDLDDGRSVRMLRPMVDMRLREEGLQRKGKRNQ